MTTSKYSFFEIKNFIIYKCGCDDNEVTYDCDIVNDLGYWGDDLDEIIDEYSKKFNVDMSTYLWYFHAKEEGHNIGSVFFKAPDERVKHIAVTPTLLLESANSGRWLVSYPEHKLPKKRYDIMVNQVLVLMIIVFFIYKCAK